MALGTHDFSPDPRNESVLVHVNGELVPRARAVVSVFDSGFLLGDGVWEGLRIHHQQPLFFDAHARRLYQGAKALDLDIGMTREALRSAIDETIAANHMDSGVHVRVMVTRGIRATPYQDPRVVVGSATVVIVAEHKTPLPETLEKGIRLFTVHVRRGSPDVIDPRLNHHSKLNCILACIQAAKAGADEALMLDPHGFVATCNSTNFFIVQDGELWTSTARYCLPGITRANVLSLATRHGIKAHERDFSLSDAYGADEAFVTGTFGGVVPVVDIDGRVIGGGTRGPIVARLQELYAALIEEEAARMKAPA
jgi:branched-chain amino acid aminotransferase